MQTRPNDCGSAPHDRAEGRNVGDGIGEWWRVKINGHGEQNKGADGGEGEDGVGAGGVEIVDGGFGQGERAVVMVERHQGEIGVVGGRRSRGEGDFVEGSEGENGVHEKRMTDGFTGHADAPGVEDERVARLLEVDGGEGGVVVH